jgi:organic radical activating enzyme
MLRKDLDGGLRIKPWKPELHLVPHLTIETNLNCNFRCKNCYNYNRSYVKPLEQIKNEIDAGLKRRKADTITILGGEPSLHKDLFKVISYIKSKGVIVQMLTNGYVYLENNTRERLLELKKHGLDRILLHIDDGQEAYPDPVASIEKFLNISSSIKLLTSISWTIYKGKQGQLAGLIKQFSVYSYFDGFLSVLEKSIDISVTTDHNPSFCPDLSIEYRHLRDELGIQPSYYLPSSISDNDITWLVYLFYINSCTGRTFYVSPQLSRLYQNLYLRFKKRELFGVPPMRRFRGLTLITLGILEFLIKPSSIISFWRLIRNSHWLSTVRYRYLAIQDGPEYKNDKKEIALCYHCPDATIRNGILAPVCLADRISPLPGSNPPAGTSEEYLKRIVHEHLQN